MGKLVINNLKLNMGDRVFIAETRTVDELGEINLANPVVRVEEVDRIIINKDKSVDYNDKDWFQNLEDAKRFCEEEMFNESLSGMYDRDTVNFVWTKEPYIQEGSDKDSYKYVLEAELPKVDKFGNTFID